MKGPASGSAPTKSQVYAAALRQSESWRDRLNTLAQWAAEYPDAGPDREALDELRGVR